MSVAPRGLRIALSSLLAVVALAVTGGAGAVLDRSPLTIETVALQDGTAVVTGVVEDAAAALTVNGAPVTVGQAAGEFVAIADLAAAAVVFTLVEAPDRLVEISIPVDVLVSGNDALADLVEAGIQIDVPADGLRVVDGQMPLVEGRVLNDSTLAKLEVNGVDVLGGLARDGSFSVIAPGSSSSQREHVTVIATGRNGVTQTNRYATTTVRSTISTRAGTSVSIAGARGLVISKVRLDTRKLRSTNRFGVVVTVKDRRGYLVRGASLRLDALPRKHLATGSVRTGFTNRMGQARFTYRLRLTALPAATKGFVTIATRASTPRATASLKVKLRLPAGAR